MVRPASGPAPEASRRQEATMRSSNPVLSREDLFTREPDTTGGSGATLAAEAAALEQAYRLPSYAPRRTDRMTLDDVIARTGILFAVAVVTGALAWVFDVGYGVAIAAAIVGFALAMVNTFKRQVSPPLIIAYAAAQGIFLGALSHALSTQYPGIVLQALLGTAAAFAVMLGLYRSGGVRVTPKFTRTLLGMAAGYLVFVVVNLVLSMFGHGFDRWNSDGGSILVPLAVSLFAVGLASFFLILDFDEIERGIKAGAPESEAWRAAFGLTVTLVWLYFEMLRLFAILRGD
jgi:uncharacterized YccA/Bax inhibitor family protein